MPSNTRQPKKTTPVPQTTKPSTRERILAYLHENSVASVQALSRAWGLTRADIRYHFNNLLEEGILELAPKDTSQPNQRGRPEQHYRLASDVAPDNFPVLCAALLHTLLSPLTEEERVPALRSLAGQMTGGFAGATNPTQRFNQACVYLSQYHYRARWEAHASGPRVLLRSCPYAKILPDHPELCDLDQYLLEHLVQVPLLQTARIQPSNLKPGACVFVSKPEE